MTRRSKLCTTNYLELSKNLVQHKLDTCVASGPEALEVTLTQLKNMISVLEPIVDKLKTKVKTKSAHVMDFRDVKVGKNQQVDHVYVLDSQFKSSGRLWNRDFRFLCPILGQEHELLSCDLFFPMAPKERQNSSRGQICKMCFKPRGECPDKPSLPGVCGVH